MDVLPAPANAELPEPTSYEGRHIVPLDVRQEDWLDFIGISYWIDPISYVQEGTCALSFIEEEQFAGGKPFELTCEVFNEHGGLQTLSRDGDADPRNPAARSFMLILRAGEPDPTSDRLVWTEQVPGDSLMLRLNYEGSVGVKDVVIRLEFGEPVSRALNKQRLCFRLKRRPVTSTDLRARDEERPKERTPLIYLHGYEDPDTGQETIGDRLPPFALTHQRVARAWPAARDTGYFDPAVFPNVPGTGDQNVRAAMARAVAGLDEATVARQLTAGGRLVVQRTETGEYGYRFLPAPQACRPGLLLVEYYRLTSFPGRYGPGRTVKTFSLLPGERTSIRVSTYKRSSQSLQKTASILDATNSETENEFARTVNAEQSNQANAANSLEFRVEAEAQGQATWGWGSASAKVSGSVAGSTSSAREEFTKNLTNAVSKNTARASSRREVQVDTSIDVKLEEGEEQAVERTLENINVSRTLNFVFRQMNQEYVTLLHLVDVRVAFFNGHAESRDEVPLAELDRLLADCLRPEAIPQVREEVHAAVLAITDHRGDKCPGFVRMIQPDGDVPAYAQVNPDFTSSATGPDGREHTVPGIVVSTGSQVLRTDGITVDSYLGAGSALDDYSTGLQTQAVQAREAENRAAQAETRLRKLEADRLELAMRIVADNDTERAALFQRLFVVPQIVNQIDHAAVAARPADPLPSANGHSSATPAL
ncbi:hypothetical protein [Sphaerisporangium aureirubrum]|uniref:Uncharacterized protein n=1 Tax=Sphaerisporangium aureirubrum TaxID=1544736 RepID=A0ABW1NLM8_9ACTN